ncbi:major royal jelly protein 1-like [Copidosoma floridanum]|uniref:major royal jelly protein 1-like n=1 Tax=Copidosoma floridanum TaxID=29053 RepID=UPI0006C9E2BE|nr:major royal jelly protein 1-like [Copidosoma floridanum]
MCILVWALAFLSVTNAAKSPLKTEYEWKYIDFDWDSQVQKNWYIENGLYDPSAIIPIDVERVDDGRTFITTVRSKGVPASLHTVTSKSNKESGPLLKPYPDWSWYNTVNPCDGIINVFRVATDQCNRLWVLDTGSINTKKVCQPKLLAFDLKNDKLVFWEELSNEVAQNKKGEGLLVNPIVETEGPNCEDITIYMADVEGHGLLVWNNHKVVRLNDRVFSPDAKYAKMNITGTEFELEDGILGMALSPKTWNKAENRILYFRPLASTCIYAASTTDLKRSLKGSSVNYVAAIDILPSQSVTMVISSDGTLFYSLTKEVAIGCWNPVRPITSENLAIPLRDTERLQFVSGMKVKKQSYPINEYLLMLSNRFQNYLTTSMNPNETNYRVMTAPIQDLVKGTVCDKYYQKKAIW